MTYSPTKRLPLWKTPLKMTAPRYQDVTSDAIAGLDRDWNFRYLNRRARQLLGANQDLEGKNLWRELFPRGADDCC